MSITDVIPIFLCDREGAAFLGVGLTTFRNKIRSGVIPPPVKIGRRSLWPRSDIEAFARALIEQRDMTIQTR
jgi:predicted DNA-binding transcriptional regulator AlpA